MDANLSFPASTPAANAGALGASPEATNPLARPLQGADFANVLGNLMGQPGRQELAAAGLAEVGLKALPLGPQIQVITAAEPLPDAASLVAFARSQGLDESTVTALFGTAGTASFGQVSASASGQPALNALASLGGVPAADGQAGPLEGTPVLATAAALALHAGLPGVLAGEAQAPWAEASANPLAMPVAAASLAAWGQRPGAPWQESAPGLQDSVAGPGQDLTYLPATALVLGSLAAGQAAGLALPQGGAAVVAGSVASPAALPAAPAMLEVLNAAPGVSQLAWQISRTPAALAGGALAPADAASAAQAVSPEAEPGLMQEAARLRLEPHAALTRRLAELSGKGQTAVWGALADSSPLSAPLDLREFAGLLTEPVPLESPVPENRPTTGLLAEATARSPATSAGAAPAAPLPSQQAERLAHYEQLAERLGQALAQRLQGQIERGEWKLQMRVDPGQLGQIQLELDMHAGGLDAVFRSDNQLTRDLISQGMSKLRDSLAQSGTEVANVWVQGDSKRQSDGNPTPRQQPQDRGAEQASLTPLPAAGPRPAKVTDGLDLLA